MLKFLKDHLRDFEKHAYFGSRDTLLSGISFFIPLHNNRTYPFLEYKECSKLVQNWEKELKCCPKCQILKFCSKNVEVLLFAKECNSTPNLLVSNNNDNDNNNSELYYLHDYKNTLQIKSVESMFYNDCKKFSRAHWLIFIVNKRTDT